MNLLNALELEALLDSSHISLSVLHGGKKKKMNNLNI